MEKLVRSDVVVKSDSSIECVQGMVFNFCVDGGQKFLPDTEVRVRAAAVLHWVVWLESRFAF